MTVLNREISELLAELFHVAYSEGQLPGISAIITHDSHTLWSASYGYADLNSKRVIDAGTIFHIGSVTKIFSAIMLMQLRDARQLDLDDRLIKYLPQIKDSCHAQITLKQLASHTSGLPLMPPIDELMQSMQEFPPSLDTLSKMTFPSIEKIIASMARVELVAPPSAQVSYSNLGIALLAIALERVSGLDYTKYVKEQILQPLGMEHSGFSPNERRFSNLATCYLPFFDPPQSAPFQTKLIEAFTPAGGLWTSTSDMGRFLTFLTRPKPKILPVVLSRDSLMDMLQLIMPLESSRYTGIVVAGGVGIGWFLSSIQAVLLAEHGGADPSTAAYLAWVPDLNLAIFIAANSGSNPTELL